MTNSFLSDLAQPHQIDNYLTLKVNPYGKISLDILKQYCISAVFKFFKNPIYVESPLIQGNLTDSTEIIGISKGASLRHTFHHFYFKNLKNKIVDEDSFPLTYLESGLLFRGESTGKLQSFTRQTAFNVTDVHSFSLNKEQAMNNIRSVISCIRSFEKDWDVKFNVKCHIRDNSIIDWKDIQSIWGEDFEVNRNSNEEALLALDFDIKLSNNKIVELSALEIYSVKIGGRESILVDFTLGGTERILSSIIEINGTLPFWLSPIQIIALAQNINQKEIPYTEELRIMIVDKESQIEKYRKKYWIPEIYNGELNWVDYSLNMQKTIPDILKIPPYKPFFPKKLGGCCNDLF